MSDAFARDRRQRGASASRRRRPTLASSRAGFPWWDAGDHRELMARCDRTAAFLAIVRDRSTGRVDSDRDGGVTVRYAPGAAERELLRRGTLELARLHRAAGARRIVPLVTPPLDWARG